MSSHISTVVVIFLHFLSIFDKQFIFLRLKSDITNFSLVRGQSSAFKAGIGRAFQTCRNAKHRSMKSEGRTKKKKEEEKKKVRDDENNNKNREERVRRKKKYYYNKPLLLLLP